MWILQKNGHFDEFQARLNSLAQSGLKIPNIMADYMCRYRGSLIGKHFKTISQVMSFAVYGLVDEALERTWLAVGRLTVLIWEAEIENITTYAVCFSLVLTGLYRAHDIVACRLSSGPSSTRYSTLRQP